MTSPEATVEEVKLSAPKDSLKREQTVFRELRVPASFGGLLYTFVELFGCLYG